MQHRERTASTGQWRTTWRAGAARRPAPGSGAPGWASAPAAAPPSSRPCPAAQQHPSIWLVWQQVSACLIRLYSAAKNVIPICLLAQRIKNRAAEHIKTYMCSIRLQKHHIVSRGSQLGEPLHWICAVHGKTASMELRAGNCGSRCQPTMLVTRLVHSNMPSSIFGEQRTSKL